LRWTTILDGMGWIRNNCEWPLFFEPTLVVC
jgi:hypothetical protein